MKYAKNVYFGFSICIISLFFLCGVVVAQKDEIEKELLKQMELFDKEIMVFRYKICQWLDGREKLLRDRGDLGEVEKLGIERRSFEADDSLIGNPPIEIKQFYMNIVSKMTDSYSKAEKSYLVAKKDTEALSVRKQKEAFVEGTKVFREKTQGKIPANLLPKGKDLFQVGSRWEGGFGQASFEKNTRVSSSMVGLVSITVKERDDSKFVALLKTKNVERLIKGEISGSYISWKKENVVALKGGKPGLDHYGIIAGNIIRLRFIGHNPQNGKSTIGVEEYILKSP